MKIVSQFFLFCAMAFLVSSCATVFSGTTQDINLKVIDSIEHHELEGVSCKVIDEKGAEYYLLSNPGKIKVTRGNGNLNVMCKKDEYKQLNIAVGDSFNAVSVVNLIC